MPGRRNDTVAERAARAFVGRSQELRALAALLRGGAPVVMHLHGLGGIGKTALLDAFARLAARGGGAVVVLDGRAIEPTERGLLEALGAAIGVRSRRLAALLARLRARRRRVLLIVDNYEVLQLADTWIRQTLVPALPAHVRVVLAGRAPPSPGWAAAPGSARWFRSLVLGPLPARDAAALLAGEGLRREHVERIRRFASGHPLALKLAAWTLAQRAPFEPRDGGLQNVIEALVARFVRDVGDPNVRRALDACAVVRRVTRSLLAAMLGDEDADRALAPLRALPFVESAEDGLVLHETVRSALAASLRAADPAQYRAHRRAAWSQLRREVRAAGLPDLWRYTADLLFLVESPVVREAFFPSAPVPFTVERARPADEHAIRAIAERHDGAAAAVILAWRRAMPRAFHVTRDARGEVVGFYALLEADTSGARPAVDDPIVRRWLEHLRADPVPPGQRVLFLRRWLAAPSGESVSPIQAACFLDIKRIYLEHRPHLRRVYVAFCDPTVWFPVVENLGFRSLASGSAEIGGRIQHSAMVDMGPASVDGWLSAIAARELGVDEADRIDLSTRAVRVGGRPVPLTPLEFGLFQYLRERAGEAVPRDVLRREVWGHRGDGASNVVDAVVRSLRRKLGPQAQAIEAIRGIGYRYAS